MGKEKHPNEEHPRLRRKNWLRPLDGLFEGKRIGWGNNLYQRTAERRTEDGSWQEDARDYRTEETKEHFAVYGEPLDSP